MKKILVLYVAYTGIVCIAPANAEEVYWFSEGSLVGQSSCEAGGDITVPDAPYKYGYRFVNWVPISVYDMTTLNTTENSTVYSYSASTSTPVRTKFSYGTVLTLPLCSSTTNTVFAADPGRLDTRTDSGGYCYCRIVGFIPAGQTDVYSPESSSWEFRATYYYNQLDRCIGACPQDCAKTLGSTQNFRVALYGVN